MKSAGETTELDAIDLQILSILQQDGRIAMVKLGEQIGLSAPSALERVRKLEESGVIRGYYAAVDARKLGKDVTAFIGVSISHPRTIATFEGTLDGLDDVLECHHVTGQHTVMLKVKTANTSALERLISAIRSIEGVSRTETMVVLSTHNERHQIVAETEHDNGAPRAAVNGRRHRHGGPGAGPPRAKSVDDAQP